MKHKISKTIKEYKTSYKGWNLTIPVGSPVANKTAAGYDDRYRFLQGTYKFAEEATVHKNSILAHDLTYYGLNVPEEYCEPYTKDKL